MPLGFRHHPALQQELEVIRRRLTAEATSVIAMLESAIDALFKLDEPAARGVVKRDDEIDEEEVRIEEACYRLLALFSPVAKDFRMVAMFLKVNADLERVADHATSIAKQSIKLRALGTPKLPTALLEMGQRVPMMCQALLAALLNTSVEAARSIVVRDQDIDRLDKRLFVECIDAMGESRESKAAAILCYRCGRELERIGDLMVNIAEDVIYLAGGQIVRHEVKKQLKKQGEM
ncbi:phosphate signaling complex protein PhoU [soil metagenome]